MTAQLRPNGTGTASNNAQATTIAVPIGSGVQKGDMILVVVAWNATATGTTFTPPAGYSVLSSTTDSAGASPVVSVGTFYKISDGTDAGTSPTFTHSVTGRMAAVSAAFAGTPGAWDGTLPAATFDNAAVGGQTSEPSPTLTGMVNGDNLAVLLIGAKQDVTSATACTFTAPTGFTIAAQTSGTSSAGNNGAAAIAYQQLSTNSDVTSPTWATNEAVHWLSVSVPLATATTPASQPFAVGSGPFRFPGSRLVLRPQDPGAPVVGGAGTTPLTLTAAVTASAAVARFVSKTLAASPAATASVARLVAKPLSAAVTASAALSRIAGKSLSASVTTTGSLTRRVGKIGAASVTASASLARQTAKTLTAPLTASASLVRLTLHAATASVTATVTAVRRTAKTLTAGVTASATLAALKVFLRTLTASVTASASLARQTLKPLAAAATATTSATRRVSTSLAVAVTATAAATRQTRKTVTAAVTATATLAAIRAVLLTLTAAVTATATLTRRTGKTVTAAVTATGTVARRIAKTIAAAVTTTATVAPVFISGVVTAGGRYIYATTARVARAAINQITATGTPTRTTRRDEDATNPSGTPRRTDADGSIDP